MSDMTQNVSDSERKIQNASETQKIKFYTTERFLSNLRGVSQAPPPSPRQTATVKASVR
jgi:hypothetical protein